MLSSFFSPDRVPNPVRGRRIGIVPRLQRGVNGSEFKTLVKLHLLCVTDAKHTTPRFRYHSNEGQCELKVISIYSFNQTYFFSEFDVVVFFFTPDRVSNPVRGRGMSGKMHTENHPEYSGPNLTGS